MRAHGGARTTGVEPARRVIFFDFGGTLVRTGFGAPGGSSLPATLWSRVLREHRLPDHAAAVLSARAHADREFAGKIYEYVGRVDEYWRRYDDRVLQLLGLTGDLTAFRADLEAAFWRASLGEPFPETAGVLAALAGRGDELGVISNHNDAILRILAHHDLARWFRTVTYSQEAGAEKPDGRVFRLALRRAHASPDEAVHVGDSWEADVVGARAAGIFPVWVDRTGVAGSRDATTVRDLSDLVPWLGSGVGGR